jgi:hypothetical protein
MAGRHRRCRDRPLPNLRHRRSHRLPDARLVVDDVHAIRLANAALDEVRRPTQQTSTGHRGRKPDPLYRMRRRLLACTTAGWEVPILRCGTPWKYHTVASIRPRQPRINA